MAETKSHLGEVETRATEGSSEYNEGQSHEEQVATVEKELDPGDPQQDNSENEPEAESNVLFTSRYVYRDDKLLPLDINEDTKADVAYGDWMDEDRKQALAQVIQDAIAGKEARLENKGLEGHTDATDRYVIETFKVVGLTENGEPVIVSEATYEDRPKEEVPPEELEFADDGPDLIFTELDVTAEKDPDFVYTSPLEEVRFASQYDEALASKPLPTSVIAGQPLLLDSAPTGAQSLYEPETAAPLAFEQYQTQTLDELFDLKPEPAYEVASYSETFDLPKPDSVDRFEQPIAPSAIAEPQPMTFFDTPFDWSSLSYPQAPKPVEVQQPVSVSAPTSPEVLNPVFNEQIPSPDVLKDTLIAEPEAAIMAEQPDEKENEEEKTPAIIKWASAPVTAPVAEVAPTPIAETILPQEPSSPEEPDGGGLVAEVAPQQRDVIEPVVFARAQETVPVEITAPTFNETNIEPIAAETPAEQLAIVAPETAKAEAPAETRIAAVEQIVQTKNEVKAGEVIQIRLEQPRLETVINETALQPIVEAQDQVIEPLVMETTPDVATEAVAPVAQAVQPQLTEIRQSAEVAAQITPTETPNEASAVEDVQTEQTRTEAPAAIFERPVEVANVVQTEFITPIQMVEAAPRQTVAPKLSEVKTAERPSVTSAPEAKTEQPVKQTKNAQPATTAIRHDGLEVTAPIAEPDQSRRVKRVRPATMTAPAKPLATEQTSLYESPEISQVAPPDITPLETPAQIIDHLTAAVIFEPPKTVQAKPMAKPQARRSDITLPPELIQHYQPFAPRPTLKPNPFETISNQLVKPPGVFGSDLEIELETPEPGRHRSRRARRTRTTTV